MILNNIFNYLKKYFNKLFIWINNDSISIIKKICVKFKL